MAAERFDPAEPVVPAEWKRCRLCARVGPDVLVRVANIGNRERDDFRAFARCGDAQDCRDRREGELGKLWPVVDTTRNRVRLGGMVPPPPEPVAAPDAGETRADDDPLRAAFG